MPTLLPASGSLIMKLVFTLRIKLCRCLSPPLDEVPEGAWHCADCASRILCEVGADAAGADYLQRALGS